MQKIEKRKQKAIRRALDKQLGIVRPPDKPLSLERQRQKEKQLLNEERVAEHQAELRDVHEAALKEFSKVQNSVKLSKERIPVLEQQLERLKRKMAQIDEIVEIFVNLVCFLIWKTLF